MVFRIVRVSEVRKKKYLYLLEKKRYSKQFGREKPTDEKIADKKVFNR